MHSNFDVVKKKNLIKLMYDAMTMIILNMQSKPEHLNKMLKLRRSGP